MNQRFRLIAIGMALWLTGHLALFPDPGTGEIPPLLLLPFAGLLQWLRKSPPGGWRAPLLAAAIIPILLADGDTARAFASGASWCAGVLLLFPPARKTLHLALLCAVLLLATLVFEGVIDSWLIAVDCIALLFLALAAAPAGNPGIAGIVLRMLRVALPVAIVVTLGFKLFPVVAKRTNPAMVGYVGRILAGEGGFLRMSDKTAMVVKFETKPPRAAAWYWRGETLDLNKGLSWENSGNHSPVYAPGPAVWRYSIQTTDSSVILPLDYPIPPPAGMNSTIPGALRESSASPPTDPPGANTLFVPPEIASDVRLERVLRHHLSGLSGGNLEKLGGFFREGGFVYSRRPGRMRDVGDFVTLKRRGYCEHYAAAGANLLRMAGIHARIVTGYRGGRWNPWLRTITVRDSDAHAWIEAWNPEAGQWIRFDPVDYVAPDFAETIERENDPARWPWHRTITALWDAGVTRAGEAASFAFERFGWGLALLPVAFFAIHFLRRRRSGGGCPALLALQKEETKAMFRNLERGRGETPLSWLSRIARSGACDPASVRRFASAYEAGRYGAPAPPAGLPRQAFPEIRWTRQGRKP